MKALHGLALGIGLGGALGVAMAFVISVAVGIVIAFSPSNSPLDGLGVFGIYFFFGSLFGGFIGILVGAPLATILAGTGLERHARWITPALMIAIFAAMITDGRPFAPEGAEEIVSLIVVSVVSLPLGWFFGTQFTKQLTSALERQRSTPPPPAPSATPVTAVASTALPAPTAAPTPPPAPSQGFDDLNHS
jgi:hypothetical protein